MKNLIDEDNKEFYEQDPQINLKYIKFAKKLIDEELQNEENTFE